MAAPPLKKVLGQNPPVPKGEAVGKRRQSKIHGPGQDPKGEAVTKKNVQAQGSHKKLLKAHDPNKLHTTKVEHEHGHNPRKKIDNNFPHKAYEKTGKTADKAKLVQGHKAVKQIKHAVKPVKKMYKITSNLGRERGWALLGAALKNRRKESNLQITATELGQLGHEGFSSLIRGLLKQKLAILYIPCWALGIVMFVYMHLSGYYQEGIPPTAFASESYDQCWKACAVYIGVVFYGFAILVLRVSSIPHGILFLFLVTVVFNMALTSVSRCYYFYSYDTFESALQYTQLKYTSLTHSSSGRKDFMPNSENLNQLFLFYSNLQTTNKCCGWDDIDIAQSWPILLGNNDFPKGCCKKPKDGCGRFELGYSETSWTKDWTTEIKTDAETGVLRAAGVYMDIQTTISVLTREDWEFHNPKRAEKNKPILDPTNGETLFFVDGNSRTILSLEYLKILDYTQSQLGKTDIKVYWDVTTTEFAKIPANQGMRQVYASMGHIYTNQVKDRFWTKSCEKIDDPEKELRKIQLSMNLTFPLRGKPIQKYQVVFMDRIRLHVIFYALFASVMIIMVGFLTWIFWHYYALMKAEELTDLGYPPDFDLLNLQLQGYENEALTDKQKLRMQSKSAQKKKANTQKGIVSALRQKLKQARRVLESRHAHARSRGHLQHGHEHEPHRPELHPSDSQHLHDVNHHDLLDDNTFY